MGFREYEGRIKKFAFLDTDVWDEGEVMVTLKQVQLAFKDTPIGDKLLDNTSFEFKLFTDDFFVDKRKASKYDNPNLIDDEGNSQEDEDINSTPVSRSPAVTPKGTIQSKSM